MVTTVERVCKWSAKSVTPVIVIIALILKTAYDGEIGALRVNKLGMIGVSGRLYQVSKPRAGLSDKADKTRKSAPMISIEEAVCDFG